MASRTPDTASFGRSADPQLSSLFFTLPAEIRNLIYQELWHLCSSRQHIVIDKGTTEDQELGLSPGQWTHVPCLADPRAEDSRFDQFSASDPSSPEKSIWGERLLSECFETTKENWPSGLAPPSPRSRKTEFLDILMTCKRMYLECLPSLYSNITFVFTDTRTAGDFLSRYNQDPERYPIRSLEFCLRLPNILTELYYPPAGNNGDEGPPAIFAGRAHPSLSLTNNPWARLCDELAALPNLQDLRFWLDASDLRPWHKRVSETRFFGRLFDVRVPDKSRFVLGLPELPERRGPDSLALAAHYLEGHNMDNAPFTLERGPRPNNWRVHLRNIVSFVAV
ncbi:hypothetical protein C8A00DRAFT_44017 [Chaetomidium leptoderma]|uniref:DUF7730 domain-containing protein n=1 Tax=Chaetomidium leptoderma TaxID=669021 RepID=A0AAN6VLK7_9PEZI|nr:hypothetical protein C8A00DRAFT_44017 [Chaetomidium leptoderma]